MSHDQLSEQWHNDIQIGRCSQLWRQFDGRQWTIVNSTASFCCDSYIYNMVCLPICDTLQIRLSFSQRSFNVLRRQIDSYTLNTEHWEYLGGSHGVCVCRCGAGSASTDCTLDHLVCRYEQLAIVSPTKIIYTFGDDVLMSPSCVSACMCVVYSWYNVVGY